MEEYRFSSLSGISKKIIDAIVMFYKDFKETDIQKKGIHEIMKGDNVLLISPTGSGKTEAALFPVLSMILENNVKPISALYITPLRALNRDIFRRMINFATTVGVTTSIRHGDTTAYERKKQSDKPSQLLMITPETLQNLLNSKKILNNLRNVKYVIIDEIHELVTSERGLQLSVALSRLKTLTQDRIQIIALSATVGNADEISRYISMDHVTVIKDENPKIFNIKIKAPNDKDIEKFKRDSQYSSPELYGIYKKIINDIETHRKTLIFVNTREFGEIVTLSLRNMKKDIKIGIHHSSLSRNVRLKAEEDFREDELKAVVATSSLELGIDIGTIDYVIQINSPKQVMRLIQRMGRSGHGINRISEGAIYCDSFEELLESAVIVKNGLNNELEEHTIRKNSLAVIANQIVAIAIQYNAMKNEIKSREVYDIIKNSYPFSELSYELFNSTIQFLVNIKMVSVNGDNVKARKKGYNYFYKNISMIPDEKSYNVRDIIENSIIGKVDERFVITTASGMPVVIKGRTWLVVDITDEEVLVKPESSNANPPKWIGEDIPVPYKIATEVGKLFRDDSRLSFYNFDEESMAIIKKTYIKWKNNYHPSDETIIVEYVNNKTILHMALGSKVNNTLALFISYKLSQNMSTVTEYKSDQYKIILNTDKKPEINELKNILSVDINNFEKEMKTILSDVKNIRWDLLYAAKKFGVITASPNYSMINIDNFLKELSGTPVEHEAIERFIYNRLDLNNTITVLRRYQAGKIAVYLANIPIIDSEELLSFKHEMEFDDIPSEILEIIKKRLERTKIATICLKCGIKLSGIVSDIRLPASCIICNGTNIAVVKDYDTKSSEIIQRYIKRKSLKKVDVERVHSLYNSADLLKTFGYNCLLAMAASGIGSSVASNILFQSGNNKNKLLTLIIKKEQEFRKNHIYWSS